jgi:hypothetical protein
MAPPIGWAEANSSGRLFVSQWLAGLRQLGRPIEMLAATTVSETLAMEEVEFAVEVLRTDPDTPLGRYIQFRAYVELVTLLESQGQMPADFPVEIDLNGWIGGRSGSNIIKQKVLALLLRIKENAANTLSELCEFYCAHADELKKTSKFGGLIAALSGVGALAAFHAAMAAFLAGFGVAAPAIFLIIAFMIQEGVLDEICDCGALASA